MKPQNRNRLVNHYAQMFGPLLEAIDEMGMSQMETAEHLTELGFVTEIGGPIPQPRVSQCYEVAKSLEAAGQLPKPQTLSSLEPKPEVEPESPESPESKPDIVLALEQLERERQETIRFVLDRERRQEKMIQEIRRQLVAG